MHSICREHLLPLIFPLTLLLTLPSTAALAAWSDDLAPSGPPGLEVRAVASWQGRIVVAGGGYAADAPVMIQEGRSWRHLGELEREARALAIWDGNPVVGGYLQRPGEEFQQTGLWRWDGTQWQPWPEPLLCKVMALMAAGNRLYVARADYWRGEDPPGNVLSWDGTAWQGLGAGVDGPSHPEVHAFCWHDGQLYVGGRFLRAGGIEAPGIARWDGKVWQPLGGGIFGVVDALCTYRGRLIAAGDFLDAGGRPITALAAWDGESWQQLGEGLTAGPGEFQQHVQVNGLVVWHDQLVVGGRFHVAGVPGLANVAAWDGDDWRAPAPVPEVIPQPFSTAPGVLAVHESTLLAGGDQRLLLGYPPASLMALRDGRWQATGDGIVSHLWELIDLAGRDSLAARLGAPWPAAQPALTGPDGPPRSPWAVAWWRGRPVGVGGPVCCNPPYEGELLAWQGGQWLPVAALPLPALQRPDVMLSCSDRLFVISRFKVSENGRAGVCAWDGHEWTIIDHDGMDWPPVGCTVWRDHAVVCVVEQDPIKQTRTRRLMLLEGDQWRELWRPPRAVWSLGTWGDRLVLAMDREDSDHLGLWIGDGQSWSPLPGEVRGRVRAIHEYDGTLVIGGDFNSIDSLLCSGVAWLDGDRWLPLGGGVRPPHVASMAASPGSLWLAGKFSRAGERMSWRIARWDGPLPRDIPASGLARYEPPPPPTRALACRLPVLPGTMPGDSTSAPQTIIDGWHSHGLDSYLPAREFRDPRISRWKDGLPVEWQSSIICRTAGRDTLYPVPLPGGGLRVDIPCEKAWAWIKQRFTVEGGRTYRLRVLGRIRGSTDREPPPIAIGLGDYRRGPSGHELGPLHGDIGRACRDTTWTWWETALRMDPTAGVGVASITARRMPVTFEIREVRLDTIAVTVAAVLDTLLTQLEARYVAPPGRTVDWADLRARYCGSPEARIHLGISDPAAAMVMRLLQELPPSGIGVGEREADCMHVAMVRGVTSGEEVPSTRAEACADAVFPYDTGRRSRDGLLYSRKDLREAQGSLDDVRGVLLDLRDSAGSGIDRPSPGPITSRSFHGWPPLERWLAEAIPFGLRTERSPGSSRTDTLILAAAEDSLRLVIPLVVLMDGTTTGMAAVVALACSHMPGVIIVGRPSGPAAWPNGSLPLVTGQIVFFPDTEIADLAGRRIGLEAAVEPDVWVEMAAGGEGAELQMGPVTGSGGGEVGEGTAGGAGSDLVLEEGLRVLREAASERERR